MTLAFSPRISSVYCVVKRLPFFKRLSHQARARLSTDIGFVGLALRTGCLIDTFIPESPVEQFCALLVALQNDESTKDMASSIAHVYDPRSNQSFLVNLTLLHQRIKEIAELGAGRRHPLTFVRLAPPNRCTIEDSIPSKLEEVLDFLSQSIDEVGLGPTKCIFLPNDLDVEVIVPLSAIILDYLVAYIPTAPPTNPSPIFLAEVPVRTFECTLAVAPPPTLPTNSNRERISVMKFSCPQILEDEEKDLLPDHIVVALETLFKERLAKVGDESATLEVVCNTSVFHRLAL